MLARSLALFVLALLAGPLLAAELHVPGDHPTLQDAIDAASAGDVIVVDTAAEQAPVVVDKALTFIGNPVLVVEIGCALFCGDCPEHAFRLEGPGSGTVVIANARTQNRDCFQPASAIGGGGFDELHLYGVDFQPEAGLTGLGESAPTVAVDVPYVLVDGSTIVGGMPDSDHCAGFLPSDGYAAIDAPASTVTVLGSAITGGGDGTYCCDFCSCPTPLPSGGAGGDGVVASEVFVDAASSVKGGEGSTFRAYATPFGSFVECGSKPDGAAFVAAAVNALPGDVSSSSAVPLGGTWTLSYDVPGPVAVLFFAGALAQPTPVSGAGYVFLAAPSVVGPIPAGAPQSLGFAVPTSPSLLGLEGGFQILDATLGLTGPAVGLLGP